MKTAFLTALLTLAVGFPALAADKPAAVELFVAPTGNDANPGSEQQPLATLKGACELIRQRVAQGAKQAFVVSLRGGVYELAAPLTFGPDDAVTQSPVVFRAYRQETPIVSGGRRIGGWQKGDGPIWTAKVPAAADGKWQFRNLWINGRRAVRARTPNADAQSDCVQLQAVEFAKDGSRFAVTLPAGVLGDWQHPEDVELMIAGNWAINRKRAASIDAKTNTVVLAPPNQHGPNYIFPSKGRWCYVENARELLDQPGEWYLDCHTGVLSYWPRPGEDLATANVVAPRLDRLVEIHGSQQRPVAGLRFEGLRFEYTDWQLPPEGYMGIQAAHFQGRPQPGHGWNQVPAAISLLWAERCGVQDCVLAHLGGSGLALHDGCRENTVAGCQVCDISANGLMVGGPNNETTIPQRNTFANNHVYACGREFYGAVGIWVGLAQGTRVVHNLVHDLPYSGISVGWQWNPQPTACKENLVEANHVYDVMNRLCDGGCIYTLGFQPGTVIRGNHLHDSHRSTLAQGAPNNGMFIDEGSKGFRFEQNVIYRTSAEPVRFNQCKRDWHEWVDNHIGDAEQVQQSGRQTIDQAGLEPKYRERLMKAVD